MAYDRDKFFSALRREKRASVDRDVLSVISRETSGFSKGQRRIAKYILENYDKAAFMTAGKLGKTVGVSESTVVRFAADLGYGGYPGMRKALQDMIRNRLTSIQRIEVSKAVLSGENVVKAVLSSDMEKLQLTLEEINREDFNAAVEAILGARHVYIVGMRSATALASFMGFYFNLILENVRIVNDTAISEIYEQILRVGPGDVIVGISYPRYSRRTVKALEYAKNRGAKVIAVTDGENSPLVPRADIFLFARSEMVSFLDSLVAPLSLINALIVAIGMHSQESLENTFNSLEQLWSENEVYEKSSG